MSAMQLAPLIYHFTVPSVNDIPEKWQNRFSLNKIHGQGPRHDKTPGIFVAPCSSANFYVASEPANQKWHPVDKKNNVYLAIRSNPPVKPEELLLPNAAGGIPTLLGDNREWLIPAAKLDGPNFTLPRYHAPDAEGAWKWHVDEKYRFLTEIAEELWDKVDDSGEFRHDDEERLRAACATALSVNYNITAAEAGLMKLFAESARGSAYFGIVRAIVDFPGQLEIMQHILDKKKPSAECATRSGGPDS